MLEDAGFEAVVSLFLHPCATVIAVLACIHLQGGVRTSIDVIVGKVLCNLELTGGLMGLYSLQYQMLFGSGLIICVLLAVFNLL